MVKEGLFRDLKIHWELIKVDPVEVERVSKELKLNRLLAKILVSRGVNGNVRDIRQFLEPTPSLNYDYKQLSDSKEIDKALNIFITCMKKKQSVVVNGDADADGICATTIVVGALRFFGIEVRYDFPIRSKEGHGLQTRIIDQAAVDNTSVIVTTDCGTKDIESIEYARKLGMKVVVVDHHIVGKKKPNTHAFINPQLLAGNFQEKTLSGSGVAFKLMMGLSKAIGKRYPQDVFDWLVTLAALGTISDRMSLLTPINRLVVSSGVKALGTIQKPGLIALKEISFGHTGKVRPRDISRTISPRLNAPGRIGDPELGIPDSNMVVDLLLMGMKGQPKKDQKGIKKYIDQFMKVLQTDQKIKYGEPVEDKAEVVDEVNEQRKKITETIAIDIEKKLKTDIDSENDRVILLKGFNWNSGVIGIDADRLRDRFLRPAVLTTEYSDTPYLKGSCRSVPAINIYAVLEKIQEHFETTYKRNPFIVEVQSKEGKKIVSAFGGHAQACGFSLHKDDYPEFKERLHHYMSEIPKESFKVSYPIIDALKFSQLNSELLVRLEKLSPYGQGFEMPLFLLKRCRVSNKPRPFGNKYQLNRTPHVEFNIFEGEQKETRSSRSVSAVGFGLWEKYQRIVQPKEQYDIIFTVDRQRKRHPKNNKQNICLQIVDIRKSL